MATKRAKSSVRGASPKSAGTKKATPKKSSRAATKASPKRTTKRATPSPAADSLPDLRATDPDRRCSAEDGSAKDGSAKSALLEEPPLPPHPRRPQRDSRGHSHDILENETEQICTLLRNDRAAGKPPRRLLTRATDE